jgi:hypothetical protein
MFLSQYEEDERVPPRAKELFLTRAPLLTMGKTLRDRVLWNWRRGGRPMKLRSFFDVAFDVCGHVETAALLCHNVTKAFARGGRAIHWQRTTNEGEYTDGRKTFTATLIHPDGGLTWTNPDGRDVVSIFYLLFSADELGRHDPGDWYHYFVTATMTATGAAGELSEPSGGARDSVDAEGGDRGPMVELEKIVYPLLVADRVLDLERQMSPATATRSGALRGWVLANVLSFLEGGHYGTAQDEVERESQFHRRGALLGLERAGARPDRTFLWYVPGAGSISKEELGMGFRIEFKTAAVLDSSGQPLRRTGEESAEEASSFCAQARAQARGTDPASIRLVELLKEPLASHDFAGIERRVRELTGLLTALDPQQKAALRQRLIDPNDALGRFFDCELHRETRRRLRALLEGPAPTTRPVPPPGPNPCRRREAGAITVLQPWEQTLLALMNGVDESTFDGMALITGPVLLPGIHGQLHRMLVPTVLAQKDILAITIGKEVWFKEPLDTSTTDGLKLLVHESVHVVDYDRMGIDAFLSSYVASGMVAGFRHGDIPHEQRANAVEAVVPRFLQQFPDLNRLVTSCDSDGILTELQTRRELYRQAINSLL